MTAAAPAGKSSSNATRLRNERAAEKNGTVSAVVSLTPIALDNIAPSPLNPRTAFDQDALEDLAASIRALGVLQPVVVRRAAGIGRFELVAGERRWRAAKLAGLTHIPAVMLDAGGSTAALEASITENHQRVPLSPTDLAEAVAALLEAGYSQAQAAERLGLRGGQPAVSRLLKVRELPPAVRALIAEHQLDTAHAHGLAKWAEFPTFASWLARIAVDRRWSAKAIAEPDFEELSEFIDEADETVAIGELFDNIGHDSFERAKCAECPWGAFAEVTTGFGHGRWCLRPQHLHEIEEQLRAERSAPRPSPTQQGIGSAVEAAVAAAHVPASAPASTAWLEVGDRVRHNTLGEGSILEAKPHAVLIKPDDGGKEFWTGLNAFGGGKIELLDADGHATSHTPEVSAPPKIPQLSELGYQNATELRYRRTAPRECAAGECPCFGKARDYSGAIVDVCTQPKRLQSLEAQLSKARNAENKRRHVEAASRVEDYVTRTSDVGIRELVVIAATLLGDQRTYRPDGTRLGQAWDEARKTRLFSKAPIDLGRIQHLGNVLSTVAAQETPLSLIGALVEAICRQDVAMRFHPEGGASYGALADWYVGEKLPQRTPDDWQPAVEPAKKARAK